METAWAGRFVKDSAAAWLFVDGAADAATVAALANEVAARGVARVIFAGAGRGALAVAAAAAALGENAPPCCLVAPDGDLEAGEDPTARSSPASGGPDDGDLVASGGPDGSVASGGPDGSGPGGAAAAAPRPADASRRRAAVPRGALVCAASDDPRRWEEAPGVAVERFSGLEADALPHGVVRALCAFVNGGDAE